MIIIRGYNGGAPTQRLEKALRIINPRNNTHSRTMADISIIPRETDQESDNPTTPTTWYDAWWTHPCVVEETDEYGDAWLEQSYRKISHLCELPPPPRYTLEQRLAMEPIPTLDGWTEEQVSIFGGPDAALELAKRNQRTYLQNDMTVNAYDWVMLAADICRVIDAVPALVLTAEQRAHVAASRYLEAQQRVEAERDSLAAHMRNARSAGTPATIPNLLLNTITD